MSPPPPSSDLAVGTHLVTPRRGFVHHGLYAGDGRVIHYAGLGRRLRAGPVEEVTLEQFARGRGYSVRPSPAPRYAGAAAVERARSRLGENRYRVTSNNCEHFVHWCVDGVPRSAQVDALRARLRAPLAAVATLLGGVATSRRAASH